MGLFDPTKENSAESAESQEETSYPSYRLPTTNAQLVLPSGRILHSPDAVYTPSDDEANEYMRECVRVGNAFVENGQQLTPQQTFTPNVGVII